MKLLKLIANNLFSFENLEIDFQKFGDKILLLGINHDDDGMDSNGSGKTSILNIIYWTLFGSVLDKRENDEVLRRGAEKGFGKLIFDNTVNISRTIDKNNKKHLSLGREGQNLTDTTNTKTQQLVNSTIGCDAKSFLHSHFMSSDFSNAFIGKDTTPKERAEVFEKFIDSDTLNACKKLCEERIKGLKEKLTGMEGELSGFESILEEYDEEEIKKELKKATEELKELTEKRKELQKELHELEEKKERYIKYQSEEKARGQLNRFEAEMKEFSDKEIPDDVSEEIAKKQTEFEALEKFLIQDLELICPKCGTALYMVDEKLHTLDTIDMNEKELEDRCTKLNNELYELRSQQKIRDDILSRINNVKVQIDSLKGVVSANAETVEFNETEYDDVRNKLHKLSEQENEVMLRGGDCESKLENIKHVKKNVEKVKANIKEVGGDIEKYTFWKIGFSQIKTNRIETILPLFEYETNLILSKYFESGLSIAFRTTKELKRGGSKIELNVDVMDADGVKRSFESYSMGQCGRIAVAVTLARKAIFGEKSQLEILLIDELLDSLDDIGRQKLIEIIQDLPYQMLIISHSEFFKNSFSDVITIEYENGVSKI